ncbi:MAG: phosphate ABC transporter permease PstA [Calditrichia bacterium]
MAGFDKSKNGDKYIALSATGLLLTIAMLVLIIAIILSKGLSSFWPGELARYRMENGKQYLGEVWAKAGQESEPKTVAKIQLKIGNRDLYGLDFVWIDLSSVNSMDCPATAVTLERMEYGNFYGFIRSFVSPEGKAITFAEDKIEQLNLAHSYARELDEKMFQTESRLNRLERPIQEMQHQLVVLQQGGASEAEQETLRAKIARESRRIEASRQKLQKQLTALRQQNNSLKLVLEDVNGQTKEQLLGNIVRIYFPNKLTRLEKAALYAEKFWEFISAKPRESNTEGGVFPAIFGTVLMVLLMTIAVVPIGVLAAIYLNEYASQGVVVRMIRLAVNNLAGVPSIVFGIFGLGFFVYVIGGTIDQLFFAENLPEPTFGTGGILWASLTLALLTLPVVVVATEEGLLAVPRANKEGALALGATKWQMIRKIVLPNAMPGILTGIILAISRGAGEVAPLMITGVVKLAPSLPLDANFPFLHLERKFMHLGFHIYDVGFQSPNVEAAKPMVFTTALLLIVLVIALNLVAIFVRNSLRKKYKTSTF